MISNSISKFSGYHSLFRNVFHCLFKFIHSFFLHKLEFQYDLCNCQMMIYDHVIFYRKPMKFWLNMKQRWPKGKQRGCTICGISSQSFSLKLLVVSSHLCFFLLVFYKAFSSNSAVILVFDSLLCQRSVHEELVRMQPKFKQNLLECVAVFQNDVSTFMEQYDSVSNLWIFKSGHFSVNQFELRY